MKKVNERSNPAAAATATAEAKQPEQMNIEDADPRVYPNLAADYAKHPGLILYLDPETIRVPAAKFSGRSSFPRDKKRMAELRDSIIAKGVIDPIQFRFGEANGEAVLTKGFGRLAIVKQLNEEGKDFPGGPGIAAILDDADVKQSFIRGVHHNIKGNALSPIDLMQVIETLKAEPFNLKQSQAAKELGLTEGGCSQFVALRKLPEKGQKLVHDMVMPVKTALEILKLDSEEEMTEEISRFLSEIEAGSKKTKASSKVRSSVRGKVAGKKVKRGKHVGKEVKAGRTYGELKHALTEYSNATEYGKAGEICNIVLDFCEGKGGGDGTKALLRKIQDVLSSGRKRAA